MIIKVRIRGYRKFRDFVFAPHVKRNILVGENEAGKSTLLEAISLALTGRMNGRSAAEELHPYWFNQDAVAEFFRDRAAGVPAALPEIDIEVFLDDRAEFAKHVGAHNSDLPTRACPGVRLRVLPNPDYAIEIEAHLGSGTSILPTEYYKVEWHTFADYSLSVRPREFSIAVIDSRTIRSSNGVDYHLRQILGDHLQSDEKAAISLAFRTVKEQMTSKALAGVNAKMVTLTGALDDSPISLAMDQTARTSWDASIVPHVANIPFAMAGQGQQAAMKIALAMSRHSDAARVVMLEEPENHLSHTSLNTLLNRIDQLAGEDQQLFITTHSSFVINRLGLDGLKFVSAGQPASMSNLTEDTIAYFKKLPGYDTLRMVLAARFVLVEGPSDEILFDHFYKSVKGRRPIEDGIDVISMRGLAFARGLELARALGKHCAMLRDNDGRQPDELIAALGELVDPTSRRVFIGDPSLGFTLEPQVLAANSDKAVMRRVLGLATDADIEHWMTNNKTEAALRIAEGTEQVEAPHYFKEAIEYIHGVG